MKRILLVSIVLAFLASLTLFSSAQAVTPVTVLDCVWGSCCTKYPGQTIEIGGVDSGTHIYATPYFDNSPDDTTVRTYSTDNDGNISFVDLWDIDTDSESSEPALCYMIDGTPDIYVMAYRDVSQRLELCSFGIFESGVYDSATGLIDYNELETTGDTDEHWIFRIDSDTLLLVYDGWESNLVARTWGIAANGLFTGQIDGLSLESGASQMNQVRVDRISNSMFVATANDGDIKSWSFTVDTDGDITKIDEVVHDTANGWASSIAPINLDNNIWATVYSTGTTGFLETFYFDEISGYFGAEIDRLNFETSVYYPREIQQIGDTNQYSILWTITGQTGKITTYFIHNDGQIELTDKIGTYSFAICGGLSHTVMVQNQSATLMWYDSDKAILAYSGGSNGMVWRTFDFKVFPTVSTDLFTVDETIGEAEGTILGVGDQDVTTRGFCWNTLGNPTISGSKTSTSGTVTAAMTPYYFDDEGFTLPDNDEIYLRAYATSSEGTGYGENLSMITTPQYTDYRLQFQFEPLHILGTPTFTIQDQSSYDHDATYTLEPMDSCITAVVSPMEVSEIEDIPPGAARVQPDIAGELHPEANPTEEEKTPTDNPLSGLVVAFSGTTSLDEYTLWMLLYLAALLVTIILIEKWFHIPWITAMCSILPTLIFWLWGPVPFYVALLHGLVATYVAVKNAFPSYR